MSSLVFPNYLPGIVFTQTKTPTFNTGIQSAVTDKESRISYRAFPIYKWELSYEVLRDDTSRANLAGWSQDVTQWSASRGGTGIQPIVVANYGIAPDGTLTADRVILNKGAGSSASDFSIVTQGASAVAGTQYTISVWMKTNDGSTVAVGLSDSLTLTSAFSVGPSWQRYSITVTATINSTNVSPRLIGASGTANFADLAIWGAQVEPGPFATQYIMTQANPVVVGDLKTIFGLFNQMQGQQDTFLYQDPDFNTVSYQQFGVGNGSQTAWQLTAQYMQGNSYPGPYGLAGLPELIQNFNGAPQIYLDRGRSAYELLTTTSHTNLCLQSQDLSQAVWSKSAGGTGVAPVVTAAFAAAPDGTTTATRVQLNRGAGNSGSDFSDIQQSISGLTANAAHAGSIWLKTNDGSTKKLFLGFTAGGGLVPSQIAVTVNGSWQRFSITGQINGIVGAIDLIVTVGSDASADLLVWGAQFETGAFVTVYVPTTTVAVTFPANYSMGPTGAIIFSGAISNGAALLWSGSFYYRCRFNTDSIDFGNFMFRLWELKKLTFKQIKL